MSLEASPLARSFRRIEAVVNVASGSVGLGAARTFAAIIDDFGLDCRLVEATGDTIEAAVRAAVDAAPDLLIILAGDGTARLAAELCGADGPLVAPLPGGTMNMLPYAIYGRLSWPEALKAALGQGAARSVSGGMVGGRAFYVAAILGAPALWAPAREAARGLKLALAWRRARYALKHAFAGQLRFVLDDGARRKAEALVLLCPLVSRAFDEETALEAVALDVHDARETFRLGLSAVTGDWRRDPAVSAEPCRHGRAWARGQLPCLLDGESQRLERDVEIAFRDKAFRTLAPPAEAVRP